MSSDDMREPIPEMLAPGVRFGALPMAAIAEAHRFHEDGFLVVPRLVGPRTVRRLRAAVDRLVARGAELVDDATLDGMRYQVQSASGRPSDGALEPGALRKITFPSKADADFAGFRHDARLLRVLEALGLPRARCAVDQINLKAPLVGTAFPWHQDLPFLTPRVQEDVERHGGANAILALDSTDAENGAFEVLARTHLGGRVRFDYDLGSRNEGVFDETGRTVIAMEPGDAVFFHPLLAHGSGPNLSARARRLVAFWFVGADPEPARRRAR